MNIYFLKTRTLYGVGTTNKAQRSVLSLDLSYTRQYSCQESHYSNLFFLEVM